jgi:hypothetical protein
MILLKTSAQLAIVLFQVLSLLNTALYIVDESVFTKSISAFTACIGTRVELLSRIQIQSPFVEIYLQL